MPAFAHTPYDGSTKTFSIGLKPLDPGQWIEPDEHLPADLAEKASLLAEARDVVFVEEAATREAQAEVLALLSEHVLARFPEIYRRDGSGIAILPTGEAVSLSGDAPPIETAARLVQEDLVLMRAGDRGYRLVAAVVCFPSSWSLKDRFGETLDGLHAHVPHYQDELAARMNRIFASLKPEMPVARLNWSIYPDGKRHYPKSKAVPRRWFDGDPLSAFVRVERQTLRRLPRSNDILFTIKVLADPIAAFARHPDGAKLARGLAAQIRSLDEVQLTYKNLLTHRDRMLAALDGLAETAERV